MWAAIVLSLALFVLLVGLGWGDTSAASLTGGLLLLVCVAVCVWAAAQGRTAEREVDRAVDQIARARRGQSPDGGEAATGGVRADEPGRYTFSCTVAGHHAAGKEGTRIVGE